MATDPNNHLPSGKHRSLSDHEVDERAVEARSILANPVFKEALDDLYSRAVGTLLDADVGSLTASTAHATMKAVRDIRSQLEQYVTDHKMRVRFGRERLETERNK